MPPRIPKPRRKRPRITYIGANIKAIRELKGLSQLELAHKCGYVGDDAGSQICHIESGNRQPRFTTLIKLAKVLGVNVESLVKETKPTVQDY